MQIQAAARRPSILAILLAICLAACIGATAIRPAMAESAGQASTRNIILGAVATVAAIILYNNYEHKKAAARTIVGRTADGGIVYGNGQVVYPNGRVYYPSNDGRTPCAYDGEGPYCDQHARLYEGHRRGHAYGRHKHDRDDQRNGDNNDDNGDQGG
ncbi:MAG TPA: hypothetical protein VJN22_07545 [Candidatus Eremiobacteraceae bacterium]|nr:hypothetical protein [Candidatus Eremiobacteraceae bacterium]